MAKEQTAVAHRKRHKKWVKAAKGAWGRRSKIFRRAKETVMRGMAFATTHRKLKKREFRALWITRIHAPCEAEGIRYSQFIAGLKAADIHLDRKVLADLAVTDAHAFKELVQAAREKVAA